MGGIFQDSFVFFTPHGRTLEYYPHIHYIAPGGSLSTDTDTWHPSQLDFYLPVKDLSTIIRAKFRDGMQKAGLIDQIPDEVWSIDWIVNSQAVRSCKASLKYLAPYVFESLSLTAASSRSRTTPSSFAIKNPEAPALEPWLWMSWNSFAAFVSPFCQPVL